RASGRASDDGVIGPLRHMYPDADIPLLQISLVAGATSRALYALGRKIGVLSERGYLLCATGSIVYNPNEIYPREDVVTTDWAREFDAWIANALADAEMERVLNYRAEAPDARRAQPRTASGGTDAIDPLFFIAGVASLYDHAVGF